MQVIIRDISERKRVEEALQNSEKKYRDLFNDDLTGNYITTAEGKILLCNLSFAKIYGYDSVDEIMKEPALSLYQSPKDRQQFINLIIEKKKLELFEEKIICRDGKEKIILENTVGEFDENNKLVLLKGYIIDITERKRAEEELRESEERFRSVAQSANDAIITSDIKGKISGWNKGAEKMFGYSESEIAGKPLTLIMPQEYIEQHVKDMKRIASGGEKHVIGKTLELKGLHKNGNEFPMELSLSEWETSSGKFFTGIIRDITDRKQAEKEIRRTNIFLDSIVENIPNMIFMKEADELRFVWFNQAGENLLGIHKQELLGKNDYDFFSKEQADSFTEKDREVLQSKEMLDIPEEPIQTKHQGIRILHTIKVPIMNDLGEPLYLLGISEDITYRKQAEEKTQLLAHTIRSITEIITITDLEDKLTFVNQAFVDIYGYSSDEIIGKHVKILRSPNNPPELFKDLLEHSRKNGLKGELLNLTKDGSEFPISMQTSKILNENGDIIGLVGIAEDITERKQAEMELYQARNDWESTFDTITDMITIHDENYNIIRSNKAAKTHLGLPELNKIFEAKCFKYYHGNDNPPKGCPSCDCLKTGLPGVFELFEPHLNLHLEIRAIPRFDMDNHLIGLVHVVRDITERKKEEASIVKLSKAVETSREAIFHTDRDGVFTFINPGFTKLYGYTSSEVVGKTTPRILKSGTYEPQFYENFWKSILSGKDLIGELVNKTKDGKLLDIEGSASPIFDDNKNIIGFLGIQRNITERKQAEENLIVARDKAEVMNRLKSNFLANMSHEIRTPLNGILGFSDIIKEENDLEEVKKMAGIINDSGNRLLNSLNQILDLSSLESNSKKVNYKLIDINYLIKETTVLFSIAAQIKILFLSCNTE